MFIRVMGKVPSADVECSLDSLTLDLTFFSHDLLYWANINRFEGQCRSLRTLSRSACLTGKQLLLDGDIFAMAETNGEKSSD
jgi:hypothetical protein